ncbi:MAG: TatD family hydrolase [Candidatus Limiplasma sp.]|nr:TatD family hydrolase [Candidatus Limiplasma sp.]
MSALFDSHCHLEDERFAGDLEAVLERMAEHGVSRCLLAGSDMGTSRRIAALTQERDMFYGGVGVHPHEAKFFRDEDLDQLRKWLALPRVVAVGEIGLDYYYDHSPRETQREVFAKQLRFAYEQGVAAIFHVRDAHGDMLDMLRASRGALPKGVLHCYSGSVESARLYLDMGFYLSFAGPVTFKNARNLLEVASFCPLDRLLVETDSPYLAPEPMRGKRNEPSFVRFVAQRVAQIKGMSVEELVAAATENTCRLFGIENGSMAEK